MLLSPHCVPLLVAALAGCFLVSCDDENPPAAPKPTAAFAATVGACLNGCPVIVNNQSQHATAYTWDFGDNTTSTQAEASFVHAYAQPGMYRVKLKATGAGGTDTTSQRVTVGSAHGGSVVHVTNTIVRPTTWEQRNVYVVDHIIQLRSTLTIEAGTVVKFTPNGSLQLDPGGRVVAIGSMAQPIVFTSIKDDAHGGDTNGDGTTSTPAKRDWAALDANSQSNSMFTYCRFLYGGHTGPTLDLSYGTATVTHCTFAHNGSPTASATRGATLNASYAKAPGTVIQNNVFYDNVRPLPITCSLDLDDSNTFHNPANAAEKNQYQGIAAYWDVNVSKLNVSWAETEVAYVATHDVDLKVGNTLRLGNGVTVKFMPEVRLLFRDSPGQLLNGNGAGVAFTSYKDDTRGGDSNGNGAANAPAAGDWAGLYHDTAAGDWLTWGNIYYASH